LTQQGDHLLAALGKGVAIQLIQPDPLPGLTSEGLRATGNVVALERVQRHSEVRVGVLDGRQLSTHLDLHAQLLADLTDHALGQGFVRLELADPSSTDWISETRSADQAI